MKVNKTALLIATGMAVILTATACSSTPTNGQVSSAASSPSTASSSGVSSAPSASDAAGATSSAASPSTAGTAVTADQAKQIALEAAGIQESDLLASNVRQELDNGIEQYSIDFYTPTMDFEYDIEASTGRILNMDRDVYDSSWTTPAGAAITKEAAMSSALAKVPGATEQNLRMTVKLDNGQNIYEGEIIYGDKGYEFKINTQTGAFIEWSEEALFDNGTAQNSGSGAAQAKSIAMQAAGIQESDIIAIDVREELDNAIQQYKVEIYTPTADYEYDIEAATGKILSMDRELYDSSWTTPAGATFTKEQAVQAVLAKVPGATERNLRMKVELDNGRNIYEGEVIYNDKSYDFKIDTQTGDFSDWNEESLFD